jgi:hypothetical protein
MDHQHTVEIVLKHAGPVRDPVQPFKRALALTGTAWRDACDEQQTHVIFRGLEGMSSSFAAWLRRPANTSTLTTLEMPRTAELLEALRTAAAAGGLANLRRLRLHLDTCSGFSAHHHNLRCAQLLDEVLSCKGLQLEELTGCPMPEYVGEDGDEEGSSSSRSSIALTAGLAAQQQLQHLQILMPARPDMPDGALRNLPTSLKRLDLYAYGVQCVVVEDLPNPLYLDRLDLHNVMVVIGDADGNEEAMQRLASGIRSVGCAAVPDTHEHHAVFSGRGILHDWAPSGPALAQHGREGWVRGLRSLRMCTSHGEGLELPVELGEMTQLERLHLSISRLDRYLSLALQACRELAGLRSLHMFDLMDNIYGSTWSMYNDRIRALTQLTRLDVVHAKSVDAPWWDPKMVRVASHLSRNGRLRSLTLPLEELARAEGRTAWDGPSWKIEQLRLITPLKGLTAEHARSLVQRASRLRWGAALKELVLLVDLDGNGNGRPLVESVQAAQRELQAAHAHAKVVWMPLHFAAAAPDERWQLNMGLGFPYQLWSVSKYL